MRAARGPGLRGDRRGVGNVIAFVLGLVIVVVIVSNVFLWNYQMNRVDWERQQEEVHVLLATRSSPWCVAQREYTVEMGGRLEGYYVHTRVDDGAAEQFVEAYKAPPGKYLMEAYNDFVMDLSSFPLTHVGSIEVWLKYSVNSTEDDWRLQAWNWTAGEWSGLGRWSKPQAAWTWVYLTVETDDFTGLVNADGLVRVRVSDKNVPDAAPTLLNIDFLAVRANLKGSCFKFRNDGPLTARLVALWVIDSKDNHARYEVSLFINPGETMTYWADITWTASEPYLVKVVTERGNIATYSKAKNVR